MVAGDSRRILVVDDEPVVRDSCQRVLARAGYDVRAVSSGRDALEVCRRERFDLMLTDLRMPDIDGLEIARAMAREFPETRIIVITGYPSHESAEQARRLGVSDYLQKPLSPDRLTSATAEVLAHPPRSVSISIPDAPPAPSRPVERPAPKAPEARQAPSAPRPELTAGPAPQSAPSGRAATSVVRAMPRAPQQGQLPGDGAAAAAASDISTLKALGLLAAAPLAGLAFVVFLPLIGFGMLLAVLGSRLGWHTRLTQE